MQTLDLEIDITQINPTNIFQKSQEQVKQGS